MNDDLLNAIVDTLDTLDVYLMANWDEHARKRLREKAAKCYRLLKQEQQRRAKAAASLSSDAAHGT